MIKSYILKPYMIFTILLIALVTVAALYYRAYYITSNSDLSYTNELYIPPLLKPVIENGEKVFTLSAQEGEIEFFEGIKTKTRGYNGHYLGPTIRVNTGDDVRFRITNELTDVTTVHWHGMHVPPEMDGTPHQPIYPGETWEPYYTIKNEATMMWYHPHTHGQTATQSYSGLAGFYFIDDEHSLSLDLPRSYGVDDIPLVIQDKIFEGGEMIYRAGEKFLGHDIVVNGTYAPHVTVEAKHVRFRILNGSNSRVYNFGFSDDRVFHQIGTDGGLLESPVELSRVQLAPGERADIVVDLSATQQVTLMSYPSGDVLEDLLQAATGDTDTFNIMQIRTTPVTQTVIYELPPVLNIIDRPEQADVDKTRVMRLGGQVNSQQAITRKIDKVASDSMEHAMHESVGGTQTGQKKSTKRPIPINGKVMNMSRVDEIITLGDTEIWQVTAMGEGHPFHVHDVQFLVLDRNGVPVEGSERGWKDTVWINGGETVRIMMTFEDYAHETVPYMYHCHIMEHEDAGMMGQFLVVPVDSKLAGQEKDHYLDLDTHLMGH